MLGKKIAIKGQYIKLDQFLKWSGQAYSGGLAKELIKEGQVKVNSQEEKRRGRKLYIGDTVEVLEAKYIVVGSGEKSDN